MTSIDASTRPTSGEFAQYYNTYIELVEGDLFEELESQIGRLEQLLQDADGQADQIHAPYSWTIKQVIGHLLDVERIFAGRALRFAVGDTQELPGMEHNDYVAAADYATPSLKSLVDEFVALRRSDLLMLQRLPVAAWDRRGVADGNEFTVRAIGYIMAGHVTYHLRIIAERLQSSS